DLEMEVRPGGVAGRPDEAEAGSGGDRGSAVDGERREMGIQRAHAVAVEDDDEVPPAAGREGGVDHAPRGGRRHGRALRGDDVDPFVEAIAARGERRANWSLQGPGERQWASRGRAAQRGDRARTGDPVRGDAGPALEVPEGAVGMPAEPAVDRRRGEAVPGEQELQGCDVPPVLPAVERTAAEQVPAKASERFARLVADDAVDGEAGVPLEPLHGGRRVGALDPVDRAEVEAARL